MIRGMDIWGNPSSVHRTGQDARHTLDTARRTMAECLQTRAERIIFTSGGTEANNLALRGMAARNPGSTILVSSIEHDCIRTTANTLHAQNIAHVEEIPVTPEGIVNMDWLTHRLTRSPVAMVSVMHANNETGVIQPIEYISSICRKHGATFHTDAVQTVGHLPIHFEALGADMLTLSAHKFGGPKGAGALVVKPEIPLNSVITGGAQERNRRAGTENTMAIMGMAAALESAMSAMDEETRAANTWAKSLEKGLPSTIHMVAPKAEKVPHVRQFLTPGLKGEDAVIALDLQGIAASQGAACSSGRVSASHVLQAMGFSEHEAAEGLRLSWGWATTESDIHRAITALQTLVK